MNLFRMSDRASAMNGWLLAALCFALVTHAAPVYILSAVMLVLGMAQPRLVARLDSIAREPVNWAFVAYYCVFLVSLLWTDDVEWGWHMVGRQIPFLLFPLYWLTALRSDPRRCISFFIAGVAVSAALAHYNWMQLHVFPSLPESPWMVKKSPGDTAPFVDRIMYAPILAFGAYFVGYRLLFEPGHRMRQAAYALLFLAIVVNLLLSGGRAGMVGFLVLLVTLIIQRLSRHPVKAAILGLAAVIAILGIGYSTSDHFRQRVDSAITETADSRTNINTSVGLRINFLANSARIVMENPILGAGVGDFPAAYKAVNDRVTPQAMSTVNPHNQIMWVLATTGALGGAALAFLLWATFRSYRRLNGEYRHYLVAIWLGFGAICQFESYLWRSNTALMFCVLMAVVLASLASARDADKRPDTEGVAVR